MPGTWTLFVHGKRSRSWGFFDTPKDIDALLFHQPVLSREEAAKLEDWHDHALTRDEVYAQREAA